MCSCMAHRNKLTQEKDGLIALVGEAEAVEYDLAQVLNDAQLEQERSNISRRFQQYIYNVLNVVQEEDKSL